MENYHIVSRKGEGTFAQVVKAQRIDDGKFYAIKCMKSSFRSWEKVNSLQEIQSLRRLMPHPNIVNMSEVLYDSKSGRLALVFELMEANLYDMIKDRKRPLSNPVVKAYGYQMLNALSYVHQRGMFHRDVKPENILVAKNAKVLKLADFGSVRKIDTRPPFTEYISTRWYRPPECLLTDGYYGPKMDVWAAGCVIFEILSLKALFPGKDELDQINKIHKVLGSPTLKDWLDLKKHGSRHNMKMDLKHYKGTGFVQYIPNATNDCISLLQQMLMYSSSDRITAAGASSHRFFHDAIVPGFRPSATASSNVSGSSKRSDRSKMSQNLPKHTGESPIRKLHKHGPSPHKLQLNANVSKFENPTRSPVRVSPFDDDQRIEAQESSKGKFSDSSPNGANFKARIKNLQVPMKTQNLLFKDSPKRATDKSLKAPQRQKIELPKIRVENSDTGGIPHISGSVIAKGAPKVAAKATKWHTDLSPASTRNFVAYSDQITAKNSFQSLSALPSSFAKRRQRKKKTYASVSSSGYGRSSYIPTQRPKVAPNDLCGNSASDFSFQSPKRPYNTRSRISPLDDHLSPLHYNTPKTKQIYKSKASGTITSKLDKLRF